MSGSDHGDGELLPNAVDPRRLTGTERLEHQRECEARAREVEAGEAALTAWFMVLARFERLTAETSAAWELLEAQGARLEAMGFRKPAPSAGAASVRWLLPEHWR